MEVFRSEILKKEYGLKDDIDLKEALGDFLAYSRNNKKSYENDYLRGKLLLEYFGDEMLKNIKPPAIEQFRTSLKHEKKIKKSTINRYCALLKSVFNFAIKNEKYDGNNPVNRIRFYKESPKKIFYNPDQLTRIVDYAFQVSQAARTRSQFYFYPFISIAVYTGMRAGEIFNLQWPDLKEFYFMVRKDKADNNRLVPVSQDLYSMVNRLPRGSIYIINTVQKKTNTFRKIVQRMNADLKLQGGIHTIRHSFASALVNSGIDIVTVQNLLGHQNIKTTQIYSHANFGQMQNAINQFCDQSVTKKLPQISQNTALKILETH